MNTPFGGLGYAVNDLDGTIVEISAPYAAALGYRVGDLLGRNFRDLLAPEVRDAAASRFENCVTTGEPTIIRCEYALPDGTRLVVDVSIMPVRDDADTVRSMLIVPLSTTVTPKIARGHLVNVGSASERDAEP